MKQLLFSATVLSFCLTASRLSAGGGEWELVKESTNAASSQVAEKNDIERLRFDLLAKKKLLATKRDELNGLEAAMELNDITNAEPDLINSLKTEYDELKAAEERLIKELSNLTIQISQLENGIPQVIAKPSAASNCELLAIKTRDDKTYFMSLPKSEPTIGEDFVMVNAYSEEKPLVVPFSYLELTALEMSYEAFCAQEKSTELSLSTVVTDKENLVRLARRYRACGQFYFLCKLYAQAQTCFEAVMRLDVDAKASAEAAYKQGYIHLHYVLNKGENWFDGDEVFSIVVINYLFAGVIATEFVNGQ